MARRIHQSKGRVFEIDVIPLDLTDEEFAPVFVACVARFDRGALVPVFSGCEVYGPTEAWAFRNACDLLDAGVWRAERDTGAQAAR